MENLAKSTAMQALIRGFADLFDEIRTELRTELRAELKAELEAQLPEWVDELEAQRLTGLSRTTLYRLREQQALEWKQDHGVHYLRASLLADNSSRAVGKGYASPNRSL